MKSSAAEFIFVTAPVLSFTIEFVASPELRDTHRIGSI
jgi:hypothetical protein